MICKQIINYSRRKSRSLEVFCWDKKENQN